MVNKNTLSTQHPYPQSEVIPKNHLKDTPNLKPGTQLTNPTYKSKENLDGPQLHPITLLLQQPPNPIKPKTLKTLQTYSQIRLLKKTTLNSTKTLLSNTRTTL